MIWRHSRGVLSLLLQGAYRARGTLDLVKMIFSDSHTHVSSLSLEFRQTKA